MTHGSLFSGIGGIDLGFEMAGIKTSWTCEIDDWCNEILEKRFPNATQYKDIKDIGKHNLQPVDIISGGFPCQDISQAGKGQGLKGARSGLWFEMWRIISELRPRWVLIENVPALTYRGGTRVLHDLAEIRYDAEWQIISARDVGARHLRKRMWIVAYPQQLSDSSVERSSRQLHKSEKQDRNEMGRRWTPKKNIQRRNLKLSNTKSSRYRGGSSKECGDKRKGSSIWSEAERCDNTPAQTTSKRGADKNIKKKNKRLGEFKIKTFEILKNEPGLDRVAYGLSNKVDRYKDRVRGLGNAVVPQIPYLIGRRLIKLNKIMET